MIDTILNRRSIRKYTDAPIPKEQIEEIIRAGMYAPTAKNTQAWHYVVIQDKELLKQIAEIHPFGKMLAKAACGILVCGDRKLEELDGYNAVNCSAATQNMLLAAHELGIGSVWLGVYPREERIQEIARILKLEDQYLPISLISFGYSEVKKDLPERFDEAKITWM
jgi:nitroreductase